MHRRARDAENNTMKKYFYFLFVALFATMSFTLTSYGDDDDVPNDFTTGSY